MKNSKKALFAAIAFLVFLINYSFKKWPDSSIKIIFCDVGQGDSVLIQQDFFQILIDSGRENQVLNCLGSFLPVWDRTIDVVILTHADDDHIGFFEEILGIYDTKYIFFPKSDKDTQSARGVKEAISQEIAEGSFLKRPVLGQSVRFPSGGLLTFLEREFKQGSEISENDSSIVFLLEYGKTRWLFTGDLEAPGENILRKNGLLPRVDVLKVGHHGSNTSSTTEFLAKTLPGISIISAGAGNSYGHPAAEVLRNLEKIDSHILRTDQLGNIEMASDGEKIWLQSTGKPSPESNLE
jgi:competence protein ComEC